MDLRQALAELPDTADGIAAYFTEQECRGVRGEPCRCPVANYLTGTGEYTDPDVDELHIDVFGEEGENDRIDTPAHVAEFVRRFDAGEWPQLEEDQ